jgi:hypothetical protein
VSRRDAAALIATVPVGHNRAVELRAPTHPGDAIDLTSVWPAREPGAEPRSIAIGLRYEQARDLVVALTRALEGLERGGRTAAVWVPRARARPRAPDGEVRRPGVPPASFRATVK